MYHVGKQIDGKYINYLAGKISDGILIKAAHFPVILKLFPLDPLGIINLYVNIIILSMGKEYG